MNATHTIIKLLLLTFFIISIGCTKDDGLKGKINPNPSEAFIINDHDTVRLGFNDYIALPEKSSYITLDSVLSDSRCPVEANCIWEGDAHVRLMVTHGIEKSKIELHTHPNFPVDTTFNDIYIKLVMVYPVVSIHHQISYENYEVELYVKQND